MPKLEFVSIKQEAGEENLRWLHLLVEMKQPWFFQMAELDGCKAIMDITRPDGNKSSRQLAWRTERGPSSISGKIQPGDKAFLPFVAKSSSNNFWLRGLNGRYSIMEQKAYITDSNGLINGNEINPTQSISSDSLSPGLYKIAFHIFKGRQRVLKNSKDYYLVVPILGNDLDGLRIYEKF